MGYPSRGKSFGERKEMHSATCAECDSRCEVPFKPNGRKPVLCSSCFGRGTSDDRRSESRSYGRDDRRGGRDFSRSNHNERPSFKRETPNPMKDEIYNLNRKLDKIISLLEKDTDITDIIEDDNFM